MGGAIMDDGDLGPKKLVVAVASPRLLRASYHIISVAHLMQQGAERDRHGVLTDLAPLPREDFPRAQPDVALSRLAVRRFSHPPIRIHHLDPPHRDVTPESSAEEDTIEVRESLDREVGTEEEVFFRVVNGDG